MKKISVVNLESEFAGEFFEARADKKFGYFSQASEEGMKEAGWPFVPVKALNVKHGPDGSIFQVREVDFSLKLPGMYNVMNAMSAICVALSQGIKLETAAKALAKIEHVYGRFEKVEEGQKFSVIVDYAPEPESLRQVYSVIKDLPHRRIIHVLGSAGGGRDIARRPILGEIAAKNADIVIVTNEDPYDDSPIQIINQVADGAKKAGKLDGNNLFRIEERRDALRKAIMEAGDGDIVLLTGKGAEQAIVGKGGHKIPWDDRKEARKLLRERLGKV